MEKNSQTNITFYIVLIIEFLVVFLTGVGIMEREAVLIMTGLLIFYFIFSKIEDSLILFIISIPLFVALPITEGFDSMANWRILLAILFLCLLFKQGLSLKVIKNKLGYLKIREKFKHYLMEYLVVIFLVIAFISLFVAPYPIAGIKKILFLINIFLLYIIIRNVIARNKKVAPKIIRAGAAAGIISLVGGYSQLISVFLTSLYNFWQWWAKNVISVFYGFDLSKLLAVSNTWFSYYPDSPPTLRMFSVFPDSHSFALFTIISLIFFSYLLLIAKSLRFPREPQRGSLGVEPFAPPTKVGDRARFRAQNPFRDLAIWIVIVLSFLALVFSGSRGIWVSAAIPFLIVIILLIFRKKIENVGYQVSYIKVSQVRMFVGMLVIFALAFPISSLIMSQSFQGTNGALAFKRAKSITDLEELSIRSRMEIWKASFKSILKRPLLGVGIGNYPVVLGEEISAAKRGASAHNLYLDVSSEIGLLGLIALLLIFWQILKKSWKTNFIFFFFLVWILIYSFFDVVLLNDKVLLLFMVALGLLYSKQ